MPRKLVAEFELDVSLSQFFSYFWDDESPFYDAFMKEALEAIGEVRVGAWHATLDDLGADDADSLERTRNVESRHPIRVKFPGTPSHALSIKHQTLRPHTPLGGGGGAGAGAARSEEQQMRLVEESTVRDIPYVDHFSVETVWTVSASYAGPPAGGRAGAPAGGRGGRRRGRRGRAGGRAARRRRRRRASAAPGAAAAAERGRGRRPGPRRGEGRALRGGGAAALAAAASRPQQHGLAQRRLDVPRPRRARGHLPQADVAARDDRVEHGLRDPRGAAAWREMASNWRRPATARPRARASRRRSRRAMAPRPRRRGQGAVAPAASSAAGARAAARARPPRSARARFAR